jgi:hypothetical protein
MKKGRSVLGGPDLMESRFHISTYLTGFRIKPEKPG